MMRTICLVALLIGSCSATRTHIQLKAGGNPVEEVITLLEDLQTQCQDEGKEEADTYDKFACFCKDTTKEKSDAINDDQTDIDTHSATLEEKTSLKADLEHQIETIHQQIETLNKEMTDAQGKRDADKTTYEARAADMAKAVSSIEGAIDVMKAATEGAASFVQVKDQIRQSMVLANMPMSPKAERMIALLQVGGEDDGVPENDFESHSGDLMDTMDQLDDAFVDKAEDVEDVEAKAVKAHNEYMEAKTAQKTTAEENLDKTTEDLNQCIEDIGTAKEDLVATKSKLMDDEAYTKDLTAKCELKAREWDQRSQMRANELEALATALSIITDTVKEKDKANKRDFVQVAESSSAATPVADDDDEDDDAEDVSFLQRISHPKRHLGRLLREAREKRAQIHEHAPAKKMSARAHRQEARDRVIELLKTKGGTLASPMLVSMAMKVAADPFVKVKSLVQDLIAKLIEEAADEASQKGWCDTEIGKAKSERNYEFEETSKLNSQIEMQEATRDKMAEDVESLTEEIAELMESLSKTTAQREEEKEENLQTLQTAQEGLDAVNEAIGVLEKFYKGAAKGKVSLLQAKRGVDDDAPSTTSATAYQGNQDAAGGILGQLAVIQGDFKKTIKVTTDCEYDAARAFAEFVTTTKGSISSKETEKSQKTADHTNTVNAIAQSLDDLKSHQKLLDDSLEQLETLKPACIDTGDSHGDRVKKRDDEIAALKSAICILDSDGAEEGTEC